MLKRIAEVPLLFYLVFAFTLGLAPFRPQPHLLEKLDMLMAGSLSRPVDVFDLCLHGLPWLLLAIRLWLGISGRANPAPPTGR
jgi:hypothetical protein